MTRQRMHGSRRARRTAVPLALLAAIGAGAAPASASEATYAPPYHGGFTYRFCTPQMDAAYAPASCSTDALRALASTGEASGGARLESAGGGKAPSRARQAIGSVLVESVNIARGRPALVAVTGVLRSAGIRWSTGGLSEGRLFATVCVSRSNSDCSDGVAGSRQLLASAYGLPHGDASVKENTRFTVEVPIDGSWAARGGKYWVHAGMKANLQVGTCATPGSSLCVGDTGWVSASYDAVVDGIRVTTD